MSSRIVEAMRKLAPLVACAILAAGCGAPDERAGVVYDARYPDADVMDVYMPDGAGPHPAVMLVHGGSWVGGSRDNFTGAAERLARTGYVAATIDYRLVPDGAFPKDVKDCVCALSYLRKHASDFDLDPARVALIGYSAGGHLVSLLGLAADDPAFAPDCDAGPTGRPRAVVDGAGPSDMRLFGDAQAVVDYMGGTAAERPDAYDLASPVHHVANGAPPFLIIAGGGDWIVPLEHAEKLHDALLAAGDEAKLLDLSGGGHLLNPLATGDEALGVSTDQPEAWLAVEDFLARTIGRP